MGEYDISQWRLAGPYIHIPSDPEMATGVRTGFTPLSARGLPHCCPSISSFFIAFSLAQSGDLLCWTFRRHAEQQPQSFHASDSRAVVP